MITFPGLSCRAPGVSGLKLRKRCSTQTARKNPDTDGMSDRLFTVRPVQADLFGEQNLIRDRVREVGSV